MQKFLIASFALAVLLGCSGGVDYGVISSKEHEPFRTYSSVRTTVVSVNGQAVVATVPTTEVDDEDWILYVFGDVDDGKSTIDAWYVDKVTFDAYKEGDRISFDPDTMSRFDGG